jgi:hypothetical protein
LARWASASPAAAVCCSWAHLGGQVAGLAAGGVPLVADLMEIGGEGVGALPGVL